MKTHLLPMLLLAAFMVVACQDDEMEDPADNPPQKQTKHTVEIFDSSFSPQDLTIGEGDTVIWVNNGNMVHTSTSGTDCNDDGSWNSGELVPDASFSHIFTTAGAFDYFCIPHCEMGMTGSITVED